MVKYPIPLSLTYLCSSVERMKLMTLIFEVESETRKWDEM